MINIKPSPKLTKIYLITNCYGDPNKVYIGKTINCRKQQHIMKFGNNIIYDYIDEIESLDSKDWKPLECFWIEQFRQWGFDIQNKNKGGGGPSIVSEEIREKIRLLTIGKPKPNGFGKLISDIKISQNIHYTQEHKNKISKAKVNHPCYKKKEFLERNFKAIYQLDKNNNIRNEFISIEHAAISDIKFKRSNISCCLTGISKTAYGYKWNYKIS